MRNPKRIDRIISYVERIWKANPDWRFNQLLENSCNQEYHQEDDVTERQLKESADIYAPRKKKVQK